MVKRILSSNERKSKERFNQLLVGLILIFLMILSTLGYALSGNQEENNSEKITYNGLEFVFQNNYWVMNIEGMQFGFKYNPKEVKEMNPKINGISLYYNQPLYIESEDSTSTSEIYINLNQIVQRMQNACINESDCEGDLPIKNCSSNFIIIQENEIPLIIQNQSCVFIQGPKENLTMITDEFLFNLLEIR